MEIGPQKYPSIAARFVYAVTKTLHNGLLIPFIYCICIISVSYQRTLFANFDGVFLYFSGQELIEGNGYRGWGSHFWPPLYPLLTGTLSRWIDGPQAGSIISAVAASLLLYVAYRFVYILSGNRTVACLGQLLVALNHAFMVLSVESENHMLDSLFFVLAIYLLIRALEKKDHAYPYFVVGMVCGLAGLTRYTSYSLLPAFVLTLLCFYPVRRALLLSLCIIAGFALISSPWWVINYIDNGSPLASWQYVNVGSGVFSTSAEKKRWWWWSGIDSFGSIAEIIQYAPGQYFRNFCRNVVKCFYLIITNGQLSGVICVIAIAIFLLRQYRQHAIQYWRTRTFLPVIITLACFIALVSQAFVFKDVFLNWLVLVPVYGVFAIYRLTGETRLSVHRYRWAILTIVTIIIALDLSYSGRQLGNYMNKISGLEENAEVVAALKKYDNNIDQKLIMARHPGRAFHLGSKFVLLPPYYKEVGLDGLLVFQGMSQKVRDHIPRFPANIDVNDLKVDYLIYDPRASVMLPQFSFLMQKNDPRIPPNFHLVYLSDKVAVYRINRQLVQQ